MVNKIESCLIEEVSETLRQAGVRRVLVAVSGGADSVALLCLCCHAIAKLGLSVEAVNCNFHLRGEESDRDSEFTADLCKKLDVSLHSLHYDVNEYIVKHPGVSTEMACRELRYADFHKIAEKGNFDRIAIAHNSDDDIETMLLNMLRGSGSRGLRGMDIDNGKIIRPLLAISRKEIEAFLESIGQDFITDSSNLTSDYRRNFIRREVLPLIEQRWSSARKSLAKTVEIMKEEAKIVEDYYKAQLQFLLFGDGSLNVYGSDIHTGTLLKYLEPYGGNAEIASEILAAVSRPYAQRTWNLESPYVAVLERDRLVVLNSNADDEIQLEWEELNMSADIMKLIKSAKDNSIAYLPNGADAYELRKPQSGDRMAPLGMKGTRLVSDIVSDAKLDRNVKNRVRVLTRKMDGEIIWVTGLKRSRYDLISVDDKMIFKCNIKKSYQ